MMRILLVSLVLALGVPGAGTALAADYQVEARVWIDGELRGTPAVLVESGREATIEMDQVRSAWRMSVLIESPGREEGAAADAIWIKVGISERIDGEWSFLTDSMLGVPAGKTGTFSVVEPGVETATPENARLYVEISATPAEDLED